MSDAQLHCWCSEWFLGGMFPEERSLSSSSAVLLNQMETPAVPDSRPAMIWEKCFRK